MLDQLRLLADRVIRLAQQHGYVVATDVRRLLSEAKLSKELWKEVTALTKPALRYRSGRYYYDVGVSEATRQLQDQQRQVEQAVREMLKEHRKREKASERRERDRTDFIRPVLVTTQDGRELRLLTRDVSSTGIRLIGVHRLLGQKIDIVIPDESAPTFIARILWTREIADGTFENGGTLIQLKTD